MSEATAAFIALHQRYAARLRLLAPFTDGWQSRSAHAELIDWPLLALHLGLRRCKLSEELQAHSYLAQGDGSGAVAGRFIEDLAQDFSRELNE